MKILYGLILILMLCGCDAEQSDVTQTFKLPPELKDYKVIKLQQNNTGLALYVLVKTNENREVIGTTTSEKNPVHTIIVDGQEYIRKDNNEFR